MKTLNKLYKQASLLFIAIILPLVSFADVNADLAAEAEATKRNSMIMEVACGVVFIGGVVVFLIWKSKHDKKVREQQMEQMKKIQAAKRKAA